MSEVKMPQRIQRDVKEIEGLLHDILSTVAPPVARCRLLSSGMSPGHALEVVENLAGVKACLGCGNCIDICPVLARCGSLSGIGLPARQTFQTL
jgi:ferredoxin